MASVFQIPFKLGGKAICYHHVSNFVYSYLLKSSFIHEVNIYIDKNRAIQYEEVPLFTCMSVYMKGFSFFGGPFHLKKKFTI